MNRLRFSAQNRRRSVGAVLLVVFLVSVPRARAKPKSGPQSSLQFVYDVHTNKPSDVPCHRYFALRAWVATQDDFLGFPKEFRLDLNGDGEPEVFLRVSSHPHFAGYSIFTRRGTRWVYVGSGDYGDPPVRLAHRRAGWHDFAVDVEGSRNSLERRYFQYDQNDHAYGFSHSVSVRPLEREAPESTDQ